MCSKNNISYLFLDLVPVVELLLLLLELLLEPELVRAGAVDVLELLLEGLDTLLPLPLLFVFAGGGEAGGLTLAGGLYVLVDGLELSLRGGVTCLFSRAPRTASVAG